MPTTTLTLHGVFIEIFELGVLLAGGSGVGKSELALELLSRGHRLVADDAAEFALEPSGRVQGRCPPLLKGFLEVRGLGVLNVERMFGSGALIDCCALDLMIELKRPRQLGGFPDRVYGQRATTVVLGAEIPTLTLSIRVGHNLAALAEAACRDQRLKRAGYDAAEDFVRRQQDEIARQAGRPA